MSRPKPDISPGLREAVKAAAQQGCRNKRTRSSNLLPRTSP